jgi:hypothetical protein
MTFLWFLVFAIACIFGDVESLRFDPVNAWAGMFLAVLAVDLLAARSESK